MAKKGFKSLGEEIKDSNARSFFTAESTTRGKFASELEAALGSSTGEAVSEGGTASGAIHRAWGELKAKMGGSDHTLLATAEQGEDAAKKAYEEALKVKDIPCYSADDSSQAAIAHPAGARQSKSHA